MFAAHLSSIKLEVLWCFLTNTTVHGQVLVCNMSGESNRPPTPSFWKVSQIAQFYCDSKGWVFFAYGDVFFTYGWSLLLTVNWLGLFYLRLKFGLVFFAYGGNSIGFGLFYLRFLPVRKIGLVVFAYGSPARKLGLVFFAYGSPTVSKNDEPSAKTPQL